MSTQKPYEPPLGKTGKRNPKFVTNAEWKNVLTPEEYEVTREGGTEIAHTGEYNDCFISGKYVCKCCGVDLFVSNSKFISPCGWPAFAESIGEDKNVVRIEDHSYGMFRIEVRCKNCNAHLGHVFDQEKTTTGERYCINSCSLSLIPKIEKKAEDGEPEPKK